MQTRKKEVLNHMIKQIPPFVVTDAVTIPTWSAAAGRHIGDGQFTRYPDAPKTLSLGDHWESSYDETVWFSAECVIPESFVGRKMYLEFDFGGESIVRINGKIAGATSSDRSGWVYRDKIFLPDPLPEDRILNIELESTINSGAFYDAVVFGGGSSITYTLSNARLICVDEATESYLCDVQNVWDALPQLADPAISARVYAALDDSLHRLDFDFDRETFYASVPEAAKILWDGIGKIRYQPQGEVIMTGHSHIDVAWLWTVRETTRKCARTFSNTVALMDHYPDFVFAQSQAYLYDKTKQVYPEVYDRIREHVANGQWDIVGNAWVEADTNVASGEALIRQLLYGHEFFQKEFGVSSDIYWLPDCFGFSWALPQIIRRSGMKYFVTHKIDRNDTNRFPYTIFRWRGTDGSEVLSYLQRGGYGGEYNAAHLTGVWNGNTEKGVTDSVMNMFGYGDGGGGATYGMLENARRLSKIPGLPASRMGHSDEFFHAAEAVYDELPVWDDEMYFENHRGTYTSLGFVKQNNRRGEFLLTRAEMAASIAGLPKEDILGGDLLKAWHLLLVNQFHDILPGTCIPRANHQAKQEMTALLEETARQEDALLGRDDSAKTLTVYNPSSFERNDVLYLNSTANGVVGYRTQKVTDVRGNEKLAVGGVTIAPYASVSLQECSDGTSESRFVYDGRTLETPFATIVFTDDGTISSFYDRTAARELCGEGYPLNTFLIAEDVPANWDNWDIDADVELKFHPDAKLLSEEVISDGSVEFRIRRSYRLTEKSTVTQDMIFFADSPEVRFETMMDWNDDHRLLKAAFDTDVFSDFVRQEIQFGYQKRPTTRNTSVEQAKFEVLNHKYTDLSEQNYGVAILNDCKYGISANGGQLRLTLHRGGCRPDYTGDHGMHYCEYSFLPHDGGFSAETVIRPAYLLNEKHLAVHGGQAVPSLVSIDDLNAVIETIKPCEDRERAMILRIYESEGGRTNTMLHLAFEPTGVWETNMLEEPLRTLETAKDIPLTLRPFEIKTLKIAY